MLPCHTGGGGEKVAGVLRWTKKVSRSVIRKRGRKKVKRPIGRKRRLLEKKKKEINSLVRSINSSENLPTVAVKGGLFGRFDYKVTGEELNNFTSKVQSKLIGQNQAIKKTTQEFGSVYTSIIDTLGLIIYIFYLS